MRTKLKNLLIFLTVTCLFLSIPVISYAVRIKDLASVEGVRENQLLGYGLVVGLDNSGDTFFSTRSNFSTQSLANMLLNLGIFVEPRYINYLRPRNIAAVMVTAKLPPFAVQGSPIDALVSSIGNARSLQGGVLLITPLKGPDGKVYAVAQGPISIGGFSVKAFGRGAVKKKNHPTVGRVVNGAIVEKTLKSSFQDKSHIILIMEKPDFTTVSRMMMSINTGLGGDLAEPLNSSALRVEVPQDFRGNMVELVSAIENLDVEPDVKARVIVDERTGTVVMGEHVIISTVAISHGDLHVTIKEEAQVSQPLPLSAGETIVTREAGVEVEEKREKLLLLPKRPTLGEIVKALNAIGVTPRDLITILQAIKAAGALNAELEII